LICLIVWQGVIFSCGGNCVQADDDVLFTVEGIHANVCTMIQYM